MILGDFMDNMIKDSWLFVEGVNDLHVICKLCQHYHLPETFRIKEVGGVDNVISYLTVYVNEEANKSECVAIVLDADTNFEAKWQTIYQVLQSTSAYDLPEKIPSTGLVLLPNLLHFPKIGVWIMPNNQSLGMIEDFALSMVSADEPLMSEVDRTMENLEKKNLQKYSEEHRSKAKIHTYISWSKEPGKPLGQAITAHVLNPEAEKARVFIDWLERVFHS